MAYQAQILKEISGEKKLEQAISLSEMVREMARKNIKEQLGDGVPQKKIEQELKKRLR